MVTGPGVGEQMLQATDALQSGQMLRVAADASNTCPHLEKIKTYKPKPLFTED
jgi:hypothetical protein